jgi:hypothetical protein
MAAAKKSAGPAKPVKKMGKAPVSAAKARYKELSGKARSSSAYRSASENRAAAGARRSLKAMEQSRGVTKKRKGKR